MMQHAQITVTKASVTTTTPAAAATTATTTTSATVDSPASFVVAAVADGNAAEDVD